MIIFRMNENGKVTLYPYGITNGKDTIPCRNEEYANNMLKNSRYSEFDIINSDDPSEKLLQTLKGIRFDSLSDAEMFINGGGFEESMLSRIEDIECVIADMIGGAE